MKNKTAAVIICFAFCLQVLSAQENKKLAQTGLKFLNLSTDPRAVGMGDAVTSVESGAMGVFFNPASLARQENFLSATFGQTNWIADIKYLYASVSISPMQSSYGVIALSMQSVDYGDIPETIIANNADGYLDLGTYKPTALAFGVTYSRALSDRFSVGGNIRYVSQNLGQSTNSLDVVTNDPKKSDNKITTTSYDFGMFYKTGFKSLNFAMSVRNFSKELKFQKEGFQLPLIFRIGVSVNAMDFFTSSNDADVLLVSVDAVHPRDYPEQINLGFEYVFMKTISLRAGYTPNNDEHSYSIGAGVQQSVQGVGLGIDYSYTPFGIFGTINRFAVQLYF
jgi:hypothetical protein